ncbi:MAG: lysoplasmalogenase [Bacteroidota bacterium]
MKVKSVKYFYFGVLIADIVIRLMDASELDKFVKPLMMPVLLYYLIQKTSGRIYKQHLLLAAAIILAWIGDILLLNQQQVFLPGGILAFLITQSIYLYIFKANTIGSFRSLLSNNILVSLILSICYIAFLCVSVLLIEGNIKYAVIFYGAVVTTATWYSFVQNKLPDTQYLKIGMSLFLMSDALLASKIFFFTVPLAPMLIIGTYGLAQFFITEGIVKYMDKPSY